MYIGRDTATDAAAVAMVATINLCRQRLTPAAGGFLQQLKHPPTLLTLELSVIIPISKQWRLLPSHGQPPRTCAAAGPRRRPVHHSTTNPSAFLTATVHRSLYTVRDSNQVRELNFATVVQRGRCECCRNCCVRRVRDIPRCGEKTTASSLRGDRGADPGGRATAPVRIITEPCVRVSLR
jgi:hypothetical protein